VILCTKIAERFKLDHNNSEYMRQYEHEPKSTVCMTVLADSDINDVITLGQQANECTSLDELQSVMLEQLERIFQVDSCVYALSHGMYGGPKIDRSMTRGLPENFHELYVSQYHRFDPFAKWFLKNSSKSPPVSTGDQLISYKNYTRSKFYEEYFDKFSIHYILGIPLLCKDNPIGFIGLYRSRNGKNYSRLDITKAELMAPLLATLTENTLNREQLEEQDNIIETLSDVHSINGVVVLNENMKMLYMNRRARQTISVLFKKESRGDHVDDWCPNSLQRCCNELAVSNAAGGCGLQESKCEIELPHNRQKISCHVQLLHREENVPLFLVYLEPQTPLVSATKRMQEADLSPREIDVVLALSSGLTNREIAETLFISINTVQTHLRSIYDKLGVRNRTSLINYFIHPATSR
jgi:DNA-binding CsgD family transcriptional regulator